MTPPPSVPINPPEPKSRKLPVKRNLSNIYEMKVLPEKSNWQWRFNGRGFEQSEVMNISSENILNIHTDKSQQFMLTSEKVFETLDFKKGFTAEIKLQMLKSAPNNRGVDLELYDGSGSRYAITITDTGACIANRRFAYGETGFRATKRLFVPNTKRSPHYTME